MNYIFAPEVGKNLHNLRNVELLDFVRLQDSFSKHLTHVSIQCVVKYKVKVLSFLKRPMHFNYPWMIEVFENSILISHLLNYIVLKQKKQ